MDSIFESKFFKTFQTSYPNLHSQTYQPPVIHVCFIFSKYTILSTYVQLSITEKFICQFVRHLITMFIRKKLGLLATRHILIKL